jgi:hypothetical protein
MVQSVSDREVDTMAVQGLMFRETLEDDREMECAHILVLEKLIMDAKNRRDEWDTIIKEYETMLGKHQEQLDDTDRKIRRRYGRNYL